MARTHDFAELRCSAGTYLPQRTSEYVSVGMLATPSISSKIMRSRVSFITLFIIDRLIIFLWT